MSRSTLRNCRKLGVDRRSCKQSVVHERGLEGGAVSEYPAIYLAIHIC